MAKPVKDLKQSGGFAIDKDKIDEKSNYWAKCKGEPRQMSLEKDLPDYVLSGRLNHHTENMGELTKNKKVVKIFLSSTFSDMHEERNYLLSKIFPKLQKFCQNQYNLDFQVVDMRWGVREEADDDHSGPKICMSELKSCQELSLGPNFVCLLGQRYGSCPTPPEISMEVWNAIDKSLKDEEARKAIKKWYAKDVNMKPPSMILKPLHEIIPADKRKEAKMSKEEKKKAKAELDSMFEGLKKGFEKAVENKLMTEEDAKKYLWSVTEEEVYKGVLFLPKDKVKNEALCFVRNIVNINYQDENAKRFVELKEEDNKVVENSDLADNVERLVEETKSHLGPENFFTFPDVKWGHNAMDKDSLKQYLDEFGEKFEKEVKRLIIQAANKKNPLKEHSLASLLTEISEHDHQAIAKNKTFQGRDDMMNVVKNYIHSASNHPFVIHGETGVGKTSLMAVASMRVYDWLGDAKDHQLVVVRRFLGTTPDSASVDSLIQSLIKQIAEACKGCKPEQTEDLMQKLDITLKSIPEEYRVVIFLDSLNQLSAYNKAHTLAWLPKDLPSNVKMIVSTLPKAHNILDIIKMRPYSEKHYLKVECLSHDSAMNLIKSWLSDSQRRLTGNQLEIVSKRLQKDKNTNPLYIKLIFDVLVKVRSYMDDSDLEKLLQEINSPEKCIRHIFKELQKTNGNLLVHRLFAYLHLSNLGLTENELVDLISLDDEVLNDVYQFHVPPLRRLPTVLWARIRNSVQNYLVTREANGGSVIAWYHRQFVEVGDAMFKEEFPFQEYKREDGSTPNATELCDLLRASMVDYFLGKWAHEKKPFTYTKKKKSKSKDVSETSTVVKGSKKRYVPAMPNIMENKRPNLRKLGQLPTLLLKLNRIKDFFKEVFGSIDGLTGLFSMNSWSEIYEIADGINFQHQLVVGEDKDEDLEDLKITLQILTRSLLLTSSLACTYPRMLGPLLLGRILAFAPGSDYLSKFVVDIYDKGPSLNSFVCPHPQLEGVGTHLIFEMPNDHIGSCVAMIEVVLKGVHYILTLSKQAVLINMEDGNVPLRYIPEDLCKDDSFYLVAAARPMHDPREIVATTKIVPNIYIFSLSQFSWQIIDCRRFDGCKEMVIQALQVDEFYDVTAIFVHGNAHNGLLVFDITSMELLYRFPNKTPILFTSLFDEHLYIIEQTERTVIKLSKDMDTAVAGSNIGQRKIMFQPIETSQPSLKLPAITEVTAKSSVKRDCMILAAKDARVYFVCVRKPESWSYVILDSPAKDVSFSLEDKQENFLMTACTEKYSYILYATEEVAKRKQDVKSSHCIEVIARIEISLNKLCMVSGTFAVGYHLGQLHTFKVDKKNIRLLRKFAAHHRPITSMIVNKDVHAMVLTAAEDGSLKMFHTGLKIGSKMLEASVFDKMNYPIDRISAMGQTTVSLSEHSDSVSIWDTSSGKITSSLKHTLQADECLKDVVCFDDYVVTVTSQGTLSFWKMKNQLIKQRVVSNIHMLSRGCKPNEVLVKCETSWHKFDAATGNMTAECVYDDRVILKHHYVNGQLSLLQRLNEEEELLIEIIDKEGNTEVNLSKEGDLSVDKLHDVFCCQHFFVLLYPREYIFFNWYTKDVVKTEKFNEPTLISSASNTIALKNNQNVQIYRVDKGVDSFRQPCQLQLKIGQENQVFITPDGDYLIVMEQKKMLLMYRVENLSEPIGQYSLYGEAEKVAFTHDSTYIVLGIADTRLFFLMLCDEQKEGHNERVNKLKECFQQAKKVKTARKIVVDAADDQSSDEEMEKDSHESKGNFIKVDMKPIAKDLHSVYSPLRALKECPVNGKK